ncbi:MAG: quinone-dependent dihydroorotate dehydrogenase [Proteobacteria bacterium]|nr:quinone-dependent dihydroorotate dehydrogenase [Pseudomonadota bacterium]
MNLHGLASAALRRLDPERAHGLAIEALKVGLGPHAPADPDPMLAVEIAGLKLPNCIGLAAGFDKDAEVPDAMLRAGFGFVECGTVTPKPQAGNPRPRLFRLSEDRAVINRMGFNNRGVEAFARRLAHRRGRPGVVGANIGANKDAEDRIADYVAGLKRLWGLADYFTVNISSPNTPGLRALQSRAALDELLGRLAETRREMAARAPSQPMFLKVAPDLQSPEIEDIVGSALAHGVDALIVSNTTVARPHDLGAPERGETGGLSGAPLFEPSTLVLADFATCCAGRLPLIGAGGVGSGAQALAKIRAGASAVQLYSAMVFDGPGLVVRIKRELRALLEAEGFASVGEARRAGLRS